MQIQIGPRRPRRDTPSGSVIALAKNGVVSVSMAVLPVRCQKKTLNFRRFSQRDLAGLVQSHADRARSLELEKTAARQTTTLQMRTAHGRWTAQQCV